jgi:hypothetical protein
MLKKSMNPHPSPLPRREREGVRGRKESNFGNPFIGD